MSRSQAYWTKRFEDLEASRHREAEKVVADLEENYRAAERQIEADISRWYQRFANNNGIVDMAEARRLLNSNELKEFKWTVKDYIKHGRENGVSADWSKELENASARFHISRLEAIRYQLQNTVETLYGNELDSLDSLLKETYLQGYGRTAFTIQSGIGIGYDISGLNEKAIQTVLYKPWALDGRNFSDRIWDNKTALVNELHKQLTQNMMRGGNIRDVVEQIQTKFNTSYSNAARLVYTENAYMLSVSSGESYAASGVEKVTFIATLDERTSDICRDMDGTIIDMKDYQPGVTVPPLHPWCRSTTAPYYADMAGIGERIARDPESGETYFVPRDMKYHDWEQAFVIDPQSGKSGSKDNIPAVVGYISKVREDLQKSSIKPKKVEALPRQLSDDEIIDRLGGGDQTKGSCSSLAFAFTGNKAGLDVLDFRGGESCDFFSRNFRIGQIATLPTVDSHIVADYNDIKATHELLKFVEPGRYYYLATGKHAAIIRKIQERFEYLELQSRHSDYNGFQELTDSELKYRFGCQRSHSTFGVKYEVSNYLIDVESLGESDEFKQILPYINTDPKEQKKGKSGDRK